MIDWPGGRSALTASGAVRGGLATGDVGAVTVVGSLATVLAGADAITPRRHPVQSPVLPLCGGGIASADRFAQRLDERGPITGGGVAISAGPDPVHRAMVRGGLR